MVSVTPLDDYSPENVALALKNLLMGENCIDWIRPGMRVGIKANLVSMLRPESAATTHPALIGALCALIREKGAEPVVGDSPGGLFARAYVDRVYSVTGLTALRDKGAELNEDFSTAQADFAAAKIARRFEYTAWLDSCDAVINFCKLKTHGMMALSACVKNMFGAIPGTRKPEMHYLYPAADDFADMLIDLNECFKPRLNIVDAVTGMEGNGPTMGTPRNIGCLIAGTSPYETDEVCAKIIGINPEDVPTIAAARRRGLVPANSETTTDISGYIVPDFKPAVRRDVRFMNGTPLGAFMSAALRARPCVVPDKCTGCGKCAQVCPASVIVIKNRRPVIDRKKCISCFCCQEFCPNAAMLSRRPFIARILSH